MSLLRPKVESSWVHSDSGRPRATEKTKIATVLVGLAPRLVHAGGLQFSQKPVDWILASAGLPSLPSADPSEGVLETEAEGHCSSES